MKTSFQHPSAILFAVAPFFGRDCEFFGINVSVWLPTASGRVKMTCLMEELIAGLPDDTDA
jgi:hypothetical protein